MNFIFFNIILYFASSFIDYIIVDIFNVVQWSKDYISLLIFVNLPVSTIVTIVIMRKIKNILGYND